MEAAPRFELRVKDLQSSALPLGYAAITLWSGRRDSNPRFPPWQGGTLPLSYYRIMVRVKRLELIRLGQQILNLPRLPFRHTRTPQNGDPLGIRTPGTLIKSQVLYQLS